MIINLKTARRDLVSFLRGVLSLSKDNKIKKQELLIYQQENELLFLLWDNENNSFFGFGYPFKGEQEKIRHYVDIKELLESLTALPPNQNNINITMEGENDDENLVINPKKKFTKNLSLNLEAIETLPLYQGRDILFNIYGTLNQEETPEVLDRLFYLYLPEQKNHKFFANDTKKQMGFSMKGKGEYNEKMGAMFLPFHLASFYVAMTAKTKVNVSFSEKTVQFNIDGKGKRTVLGALYSDVPEKIITKVEEWEEIPNPQNLIQVSSNDFWDLLYHHEKFVGSNGGNTTTYLLGLELKKESLTDILTQKSIPLTNGSKGSINFHLGLTLLDFFINLLKKGVKGTVEIIPSESNTMPHRVNFISQNYTLEWVVPRLAVATNPREARSLEKITKELKRKNTAEKIKIAITRKGFTTEYYLTPSAEGILIAIDYEGIILTSLPKKENYQQESLPMAA